MWKRVVVLLLALPAACGGNAAIAGDSGAGADGSADAGIAELPVEPPSLTPCSPGWREVMEEGAFVSCAPWPEGGWRACPEGEAHLPGTMGCEPLGTPCPAGDWSEDLPSDVVVVHVQPGAMGGDGSRASPYGALAEFSIGGLSRSSIITLSAGEHAGPVRLPAGITLQGACAARTRLVTDEPGSPDGVVTVIGAEAVLRDLRVGPAPRPGVTVLGMGASVHLEGVTVAGNEVMGVLLGPAAGLTASRIVIRDTAPRSADGRVGRGLDLEFGATAEVLGALFLGNHEIGAFAGGDDTVLRLEDALVRETQPAAFSDESGDGINVFAGARAEIRRVVIEETREFAFYVADAEMVAEDVVVRDTHERVSDALFGRALNVSQAGRVQMRRFLTERNRDMALLADGEGTSLLLEDAVVRHTEPEVAGDVFGRALDVQQGATAEARRLFLADNHDVAVYVSSGSTVQMEEVVAIRTLKAPCTGPECTDNGGGHAMTAVRDGHLTATGFRFAESEVCGLLLAQAGEVDFLRGLVTDNALGACVQVDGYDLGRLTEAVLYRDNDINLDSTTLPLPGAADPGELQP